MKRAILFSLLAALVLAVPAISQSEPKAPTAPDNALKIKALEMQLAETQKQLMLVNAYLLNVRAEAKSLGDALAKAEKDGFLLPAPNNSAKKALLSGLKEYANVVATPVKPAGPGD